MLDNADAGPHRRLDAHRAVRVGGYLRSNMRAVSTITAHLLLGVLGGRRPNPSVTARHRSRRS